MQVPHSRRFNRNRLTWADSFDQPSLKIAVQLIELATSRRIALKLLRDYERLPSPNGSEFWSTVLEVMEIEVRTPVSQLLNIPKDGPVILVANHPTGPLDGIVFAKIVSQIREDYKILTRELMTMMETSFGQYLIAVPFWHTADALEKGLRMRTQANQHLSSGGALAYFPSGSVATSDDWFGPPVEGKWNAFTAKLIRKSGATVVPVRFFGGPSRMYQIGNKISPVLRQGLLLREIVKQRGHPQSPIVGKPIPPHEYLNKSERPLEFVQWLRNHTLTLTA